MVVNTFLSLFVRATIERLLTCIVAHKLSLLSIVSSLTLKLKLLLFFSALAYRKIEKPVHR